jgi:predicted nucleic acid-binding protein
MARRVQAVLDTSFWVVAYRAEIAANCLDLFDVVVPGAVEAEIQANDPLVPRGEFPYATLFRHLRDKMTDPPDPEPLPLGDLGPGEAAAISLARHLGTALLVNERRALKIARNLGLAAIAIPETIVGVHHRGVISGQAARRKLTLIEHNTAADVLQPAFEALAALGA